MCLTQGVKRQSNHKSCHVHELLHKGWRSSMVVVFSLKHLCLGDICVNATLA